MTKSMIGDRLQYLRKSKGMTQETLANKLGICQVQISEYETGKKVPNIQNLAKLADVFGTTIDFIYRGNMEKEYNECIFTTEGLEIPTNWADDEVNPMPQVKVGDVLLFTFNNSGEVYTATVVGEGYIYSSDSGYGLAKINDNHYRIIEIWRLNGKMLKTIWRANNE